MNQPSAPNSPIRRFARLAMSLALVAAAPLALAEIHIGVILSTTGPAASLGIPEEQAIKLWPGEIAGEKVRFTILNDASDTTTATKNAQRLINEDKVDLIIGASVTPTSLAVVEVAGNAQVPVISLAGGGAIVLPQDGPRKWAFKLSPTEPISIGLVLDHLQKHGKGKSVATIGITTSYGEGFLKSFEAIAAQRGFKVVATEKYNQTDPSVTAQVLKIIAANADAVYIFAAGTPGALPQIELAQRGYKGLVYQTQGVANNDFLRVGGKSLEGGYMTVAPVLVAEQLPESNPVKKAVVDFVQRFESAGAELAVALRRDGVGRAPHRSERSARRAQEGQAGNAGVPLGAARRHRGPARFRRLRGRLHDEPERPQRRGLAQPGHGEDRERRLEAAALIEPRPSLVWQRRNRARYSVYSLGMRSVLLIMSVPDSANSSANGCRSMPAIVHAPPRRLVPIRPCQIAQASNAVSSTLVGIGVPSKYLTLPLSPDSDSAVTL
jgi:branched-chain amino acid transport system substrate-binding protein